MAVREPLFTVCGTLTYVAPEILAETGYGVKVFVPHIGRYTKWTKRNLLFKETVNAQWSERVGLKSSTFR